MKQEQTNQWNLYFFRPHTPLFFGTPSKYDGFFGQRSVMPSPSTLYGAVRGCYLRQNGVDPGSEWSPEIKAEIGTAEGDQTGRLKVLGPFPAAGPAEPWFPTPLNLFNKGRSLFPVYDNGAWRPKFNFDASKPDPAGPWMIKSSLEAFLSTGPDFDPFKTYTVFYDESKCFAYERQHGHKRGQNRRPEDEKLFAIFNQRFVTGAGYFFLVQGIRLENKGLFYFGGDRGRGEIICHKEKFSFKCSGSGHGGTLYYMLTPCPVEDFNKLLECRDYVYHVTGKPVFIGGFDIKRKKQKPLVKMVPHGTVIFFKNNNNTADPGSVNKFECLTSLSSVRPETGYGTVLTGRF